MGRRQLCRPRCRTLGGIAFDPATGVVPGDVYLVGGGDPTLNDVALSVWPNSLAQTRGQTDRGRRSRRRVVPRSAPRKLRFALEGRLGPQRATQRAVLQPRALGLGQAGRKTTRRAAPGSGHHDRRKPKPGNSCPAIRTPIGDGQFADDHIAEDDQRSVGEFLSPNCCSRIRATFGTGGTTPSGIAVMRSTLSDSVGIKAADGRRQRPLAPGQTTARQLVKLLAERSRHSRRSLFRSPTRSRSSAAKYAEEAAARLGGIQALRGEDRHVDRRQLTLGLLHDTGRRHRRVLDPLQPRERRRRQTRRGQAGHKAIAK